MHGRESIKLKASPLKDLLCAKSISLIWETKAALVCWLCLAHTLTLTSSISTLASALLLSGDVTCHFSLKALSQNSLFHQSSRRGAFHPRQKAELPGYCCLADWLSLGTRQRRHRHKGGTHPAGRGEMERIMYRARCTAPEGSVYHGLSVFQWCHVAQLSSHITVESLTKLHKHKCFTLINYDWHRNVNIQHISDLCQITFWRQCY